MSSIQGNTDSKIVLWTAGTPNGHKASILLEELKEQYGLDYAFKGIAMMSNEQKQEWFLKINPNGRIPALTDYSLNPPHQVFESASILLWLTKKYDPEHKFSFSDEREASEAESWLAWGIGGLGPMQGQANHFYRYAPEKIPYGINRYINETKRLYSVIEDRLSGKRENGFEVSHDGKSADDAGRGEPRDFLVGKGKGKYSYVDISLWPWVRMWAWCGIENLDEFPHLKAWIERIQERPAVKKGVDVPEPSKYNANASKEDQDKQAAEARKWIMADQKK